MAIDLRVSDADWTRLRGHFYRASFRAPHLPETGAIGTIGHSQTGNTQEYLVNSIMLPNEGDLALTSFGAVTFSAGYIRRAHLQMRNSHMAGLAVFHTHPFAGDSVGFSNYDDEQEPQLVSNLRELAPSTQLLSVVAGRESQCGRIWQSAGRPLPMHELVTVGETFKIHNLRGEPTPPVPPPSKIFDRAKSLTGAGTMRLLSGRRIGVVGASGTGSLVCELLVRAGARNILLIDDDITKTVNLNRMLHAKTQDAKKGRSKVSVIKESVEANGLGCHIEAIRGTILDRETLLRLKDVDIIFGCVDAAIPRLLLSQFAFQYLRAYIDVGTEIGGDDRGIASLDARVSYVAPGRHCLQCTGVVTARRLRFEGLSAAERKRDAKLGYSDDFLLEQPAVMDLNMRAASLGVILMRHLLQPFLQTPLPVAFHESLLTYTMKAPKTARNQNPACPVCQGNRNYGFGDNGPELGYDEDMVDAITGRARGGRSPGRMGAFRDWLRKRLQRA